MLIKCSCEKAPVTDFQNKTYGNGVRVATPVSVKSGEPRGRCTVCGAEKGEFKK